MATRNERTLRMIKGYYDDWLNGLTVAEIAKKYGVSVTTVYQCLDIVSQNTGVPREDLLRHPKSCYVRTVWTKVKPIEKVDIEEFRLQMSAVKEHIGKLCESVDRAIERCDEIETEAKNSILQL